MQTPGLNRNSTSTDGRDPRTRPSTPVLGPIVLVGASARAAAESARRAGFSPIVVDEFGDRETIQAAQRWFHLDELRDQNGPQNFTQIASETTPVAIVGGLVGGYRWIRCARNRFFGADPEQFERCGQPDFLREIAIDAGVQFPLTILEGQARKGWLLKSFDSSGGLGVRYCQNDDSIPAGTYLQQPLHGHVFGASFVGTASDAILVGVCRLLKKRIGDLPFVFAGAVGPLVVTPGVQRLLQRVGDLFVTSTGITGPFNVDFVIAGKSLWLLEINPRWSASMEIVERSWSEALGEGCSFFNSIENWRRRNEEQSSTPQGTRIDNHCYLKRIVFARGDRIVSESDFHLPDDDGTLVWKDVPRGTTKILRHHPIATVIADLKRMSLAKAFRVMVG